MEKLTQFVSKSFENNNNNNNNNTTVSSEQCLNLTTFDIKTTSPVKIEKDCPHFNNTINNTITNSIIDDAKKPKNWLISDLKNTSDNSPTLGIDLRLHNTTNQTLYSSIVNDKHSDMSDSDISINDHKQSQPNWLHNNLDVKASPKHNSYCSLSSPINLEDSKSCSETVLSEKNDDKRIDDTNKDNIVCEDHENKMCKLWIRLRIGEIQGYDVVLL